MEQLGIKSHVLGCLEEKLDQIYQIRNKQNEPKQAGAVVSLRFVSPGAGAHSVIPIVDFLLYQDLKNKLQYLPHSLNAVASQELCNSHYFY